MIPQETQATLIHAAFDATGVKFFDRAATLAALKKDGREIAFDENGQPITTYDGQAALPLDQVLLRYAYDHRGACDQRTLPREGVGTARPGLQSKSDFKTTQEKVRFINEHGEDAWARLPLTGVATNEVNTQEDFRRLPLAEKVSRTASDPDAFARLPKSTKPDPNAKALGKKEEMAANLAKHIASRGVGRR